MKFAPGKIKTGGRKKGTPNRVTGTLLERCEARGVDPWNEMLQIASDVHDPNRFQALKELLQYLYPKRKAVENLSPDENKIQVVVRDYLGMSEEELIEIAKKEIEEGKKENANKFL